MLGDSTVKIRYFSVNKNVASEGKEEEEKKSQIVESDKNKFRIFDLVRVVRIYRIECGRQNSFADDDPHGSRLLLYSYIYIYIYKLHLRGYRRIWSLWPSSDGLLENIIAFHHLFFLSLGLAFVCARGKKKKKKKKRKKS